MTEHSCKTRNLLKLLVLMVSLLLLSSCTQTAIPVFHLNNTGLNITHLTTGTIDADTLIAVRYTEDQIEDEFSQKELPVDLFTFTPQIEGKTYWEDTRTLVFEPKEPLYDKMNYHAVLDYSKAIPASAQANVEPVEFHFETLGQQLRALDGQFAPHDADNPENVHFTGTIRFSERLSADTLRESLQLELDGKTLDYELETNDNLTFTIKSAEFQRHNQEDRKVKVYLDTPTLHLEQDIRKEFTIKALSAPLTVLRIEEEKLDEFSQLRLVFSDQLSDKPDYAGYMSILPTMKYGVKVDNNSLIITGDFLPGEKYNIRLFPGIEGVNGQQLAGMEDLRWEVQISDRTPAVEFVNTGMFLTSANNKKITFRTMNVERLRLQVKRVDEGNLIEFFEENSYRPQNASFSRYNRYRFQRFGEILADTMLEIGPETNKWIQSELDLSEVITDNASGLYIVQLNFEENQALYFPTDYKDWQISDRIYTNGRAVKHILVSDIGITVKEMLGDVHVFLTDLFTTRPLPGAIVMLKDVEGKVLDTGYSNDSGLASLKTDTEARYIEVHSGDEFAILSLSSSQLNNSLFDIGGIQKQDGLNAFIYTERGVYRPGDEINLSAIVRNEDNTFPDNHPINFSLYNPQGRLVHEEVLSEAQDGFYSVNFKTERSALTGTWKVLLEIGGRVFSHHLRIEEIVPYRIRVNIETPQERLTTEDEQINFTVQSEYLFGAAAGGLETETTVSIEPYNKGFGAYSNFVFGNESMNFTGIESRTFLQELNADGEAALSWEIPNLRNIPSALRLRIATRVYESGGRFVPSTKLIPIDHYPSYVGIMPLEDPYKGMGDLANFQIVHLSDQGEPRANSELEYTIYRHRHYWWWEYNSQASFRRHYKSNRETVVLEQGTLTTNSEGLALLEHRLNDYGEILLEVKDPEGGHTAGYFFRAYWFGDDSETRTADIVNLKLDKGTYLPQETALVTLNTPAQGRALITVEKEGSILYQSWEDIDSTESVFEIEVKEEYIPNAYVSVIVYQPFRQTDNDLPLRMYGIVPLHVISEGTEFEFELDLPESVRPEEEFTVGIQTTDKRPAQFTIAIVDEGLLDITGFKTPKPWDHFFAKQRLLTKTYDNFSDILDLSYGYNHNLLSVGGDSEADYREKQTQQEDAMRFEPVSIFHGPIQTDESGYAEIDLEVPNYIGSLRVMVVGADKGSYGNAEQIVTVKSPVMVLPTLPRVLGPKDRITIPVTVFALEENVGEVNVRLDVAGPVHIIGDQEIRVDFGLEDSKEVFFELQADETVGTADITVSAHSTAHDYRNESHVELAVRPYNPYIYSNTEKIADAGEEVLFTVPEASVPGTDSIQLTISSIRGLNINHRVNWLIRYPYGCIEQTTSAVFPQLYLPEVYNLNPEELEEIDTNINAAIASYSEFQLGNGGFSYWPNGSVVHLWSTNYVGHFLLEAKRSGYHVPQDLLEKWISYQTSAAKENQGNLLTRAYRLYLLALADRPQLSSMNYMRESELEDLGNPAKYLLAGAYELLGYEDIRTQILETADLKVPDYYEFGETFGSTIRDRAIILDVMTLLGDYSQGVEIYNDIAQELSSNHWYSTQTTAYSLMALTKYIAGVNTTASKITGSLTLGDGSTKELETQDTVAIIPIETTGVERLTFTNTSDIPVFATLEWEGIPQRDDIKPEQHGFALRTSYYNEEGRRINIDQVQQGDSFYIVYRVAQEKYEPIDEVALVQVLPAGWEIENLRLSGDRLPSWTNAYNLGREEYVDIRDDRIMWFFDKHRASSYDFIVKINAVTVGEFYLPPTLLEAMYNNDYKVTTEGKTVEVLAR